MAKRVSFVSHVVTCPSCGHEIDRYNLRTEAGIEQPMLGCPRRVCPHCGRDFYDRNYCEDALHYYRTRRRPVALAWAVLVVLCYLPKLLAQLIPASSSIFEPMIGALALIAIAYFIWFIITPFQSKKAETRRRRHVEAALDRHDRDDALSRSLLRMANEEYLHYLTDHGVAVPEYFFRRLSRQSASVYPTPDFRQQAAHESWQAEQNRQKAHRKALEEEAEYYEYFLSLDPDGRQFLSSAAQARMAPDAFRNHCKAKAAHCRAQLRDSYMA